MVELLFIFNYLKTNTMKISIILISTILTLSVFFPLLLFIYNGFRNTSSIKNKITSLLKNNGIMYTDKEVWHHNFIGISEDKKTLTYIHFNDNKPKITTIDLTEIKECNILKTHINGKEKLISLQNLDLAFVYKTSNKPNEIINFFNLDEDLGEDYELQRAEKWHKLIFNAIPKQRLIKEAS